MRATSLGQEEDLYRHYMEKENRGTILPYLLFGSPERKCLEVVSPLGNGSLRVPFSHG